jgi:hypothetical protein
MLSRGLKNVPTGLQNLSIAESNAYMMLIAMVVE